MGISDRFAGGIGRGKLLSAAASPWWRLARWLPPRLLGPDRRWRRASPAASPAVAATAGGYQFVEIGSHNDRTFNQLLGINNNGRIAGYFGSGAVNHPNKGYTINAPYAQGDFRSENFPGSVQTQVTGLNDGGVQVGFYATHGHGLGR